MNESSVPKYILPDTSIIPWSYVISIMTNTLAFFPNFYFVIRTNTYKPFRNRPNFYRMTLIMSIEYTIGCIIHFTQASYYIYYYIQRKAYKLDVCSKIESIDFFVRYITNVTPLYFTISRFYITIKQKNVNVKILLITILLTIGPIIYTIIIKFFEIKKYYINYVICDYQITSNVLLFKFFVSITYFQILFIPFITILINYIIYKIIKNKKIKSNNINANKENKILFKSLSIQVFFPYLCEIPGFAYFYYYVSTNDRNIIFESTVVFIYHTGQMFSIFLSLYVIREFRQIMAKDFCLYKNKFLKKFFFEKTTKVKTSTFIKSTKCLN